jgi:hypothetical protein
MLQTAQVPMRLALTRSASFPRRTRLNGATGTQRKCDSEGVYMDQCTDGALCSGAERVIKKIARSRTIRGIRK